MTTASWPEGKWGQNFPGTLRRGQPEDRGHCLWSCVLRETESISPSYLFIPSFSKRLWHPRQHYGSYRGVGEVAEAIAGTFLEHKICMRPRDARLS